MNRLIISTTSTIGNVMPFSLKKLDARNRLGNRDTI